MKSKSILAVICAAAMAMSFSGCRLLDNNQGDYSSNKASSIMSSSGQTTESVPTSSEVGEIYTVTIHIKFVPNLIFSKYDVDLYIDEVKQETLKHGEDADFEFKLLSGEHTIMFANHDDSSVSGSTSFNVRDDIETAYKISCHYDGVDVEVDNGETTNESSVISSEQFETSTASVPEESVSSVSEPEIVSTPNVTNETLSQRNAVKKAESYLRYQAFSHDGLVDQLEFEGFSNADAVYGADNCGADWNEQAVKMAKSYLRFQSFSREGLIVQLEFEKFTHEQAVYGVDNSGLDSSDQALQTAKDYLKYQAFSYSGLVSQLEFEGFSHEDAVAAVDSCGANWNEQASKKAKEYLDFMAFSRDELISQLEYEGFTHDQAVYGVSAAGF